MTIYNFEKSDFVSMVPANGSADLIPRSLATTLWTEMQNHGFKLVATDNAGNSLTGSTKAVILEPKPEVDPLVSTSPWRIYMEVFGSSNIPGNKTDATTGAVTQVSVPVANTGLRFAVGTPDQIPDDITKRNTSLSLYPIVPAQIVNSPTTYNFPGAAQGTPRAWDSATMSLSFTSAQRGVVIAAWMNDILDSMEYMGVVCIQRGVSCGGSIDTGATGQKPLFMVTNISPVPVGTGTDDKSAAGPHSNWYYQVVREVDTIVSAPLWGSADSRITDNGYNYAITTVSDDLERRGNMLYRFPIKWLAPVISDTNQYHLIFPFGLCTSRFAYSEEIDLLAVSKADAYRTGQQIPINVYGESGDRLYTALTSNSKNNGNSGGIRVFVLASGPGN